VVRKKGIALFYGDRVGGADVIFGEEGDYNHPGALTLEVLDPLKREPKPIPLPLAARPDNELIPRQLNDRLATRHRQL